MPRGGPNVLAPSLAASRTMNMESDADEPPAPPPATLPRNAKQRGMYSEMLSQGLGEQDVMSGTKFSLSELHTQRLPVADSFTRTGLDHDRSNQATESFDHRAIEPKVIAAFKPPPGGMPRKLEIERKKRLYAAQDVEMLLSAKGISYLDPVASTIGEAVGTLPLVAFDNADYEIRSPEGWMRLGAGVAAGTETVLLARDVLAQVSLAVEIGRAHV